MGMMISEPQPESSPRPLKSASRLFLLFACLSALVGCQSGPPPAPASDHVLSESQISETMLLLETLAQESPDSPRVALDLLPSDGIRWGTIQEAVAHAVAVADLQMAITQAIKVSEDEKMFYLIDSHAWPSRITVRRIDDQPGVEVEVLMGPDPVRKRRQLAARDVAGRVLDSIRLYGRIKRLDPYEIHMTPRRVISSMTREAPPEKPSSP